METSNHESGITNTNNSDKTIATATTVDNWKRFQRFLSTGSDKCTDAYRHNAEIKVDSLNSLLEVIKENRGLEAVQLIRRYKEENLVVKNETLVYSLAVCARSNDLATKKAAYDSVNIVCENPIEFFRFVNICESISFEISYKIPKLGVVSKNSVDIIKINKPCTPRPIIASASTIKTAEDRLSRQSSAGLRPLLALRLNSGKSSQVDSKEGNRVIIETAEIFSSRKASSASTLRSELTFLATERKESAKTPVQGVTHLPSLNTPRLGSATSVRKGELPLISERTGSGKSRNQTPLHNAVTRPGSAKPLLPLESSSDLGQQVSARRFSDSHSNSTNQMAPAIVSPANVHASYASTGSPSVTSRQPSGKSIDSHQKPASRPASAAQVPPIPAPRLNSATKTTPTELLPTPPASEPPKPTPRLYSAKKGVTVAIPNKQLKTEKTTERSLNFATSVEVIPSEIETTSALHVAAESKTVTEDPDETLKVIELNGKHVVLETAREPTVIKPDNVNGATGWGRAHRRAVSAWYTSKDPKQLVFLITKFQKRLKWTHGDVLKLSHPKSADAAINMIFKHITKGFDMVSEYYKSLKQPSTETTAAVTESKPVPLPTIINHETLDYVYEYLQASLQVKKSQDKNEIVKFVEKFHFHFEHLNTKMLKDESVFLALVEHSMTLGVILRNLNKLSTCKRFSTQSQKYVDLVCERLKNQDEISKSRLTSFRLLSTMNIYEKGHSEKGRIRKWNPDSRIVSAMYAAFHESLHTGGINSTKKICVVLNVWKYSRASLFGSSGLNTLETAIFMCMKHLATEENCKVYSIIDKLEELGLKTELSFKENYSIAWKKDALGSTAYHKAIEVATNESLDFDVFVVYTNLALTTSNLSHLMKQYRLKLNNPKAKLIVVSLISSLQPVCSSFDDPLMLDIMGFSQNTPNVILNFISDKF